MTAPPNRTLPEALPSMARDPVPVAGTPPLHEAARGPLSGVR